jgi:type VI secretion system protein ImpM
VSREALIPGAGKASLGYFGKIPVSGDFVSRGLPRTFVDPWVDWLNKALARSREQLGNRWLDCYLTSPIWCFVLPSQICGDGSWAGVLMPSVDRVGRYFPFTLAAQLPQRISVFSVVVSAGDWFKQAEKLAVSALDDAFQLEALEKQLQILGAPEAHTNGPGIGSETPACDPRSESGLHFSLGSSEQPDWSTLAPHLLSELLASDSLWWTAGSNSAECHIDPALIICQGLPPIRGTTAMIDGQWQQRGWRRYCLTEEGGRAIAATAKSPFSPGR